MLQKTIKHIETNTIADHKFTKQSFHHKEVQSIVAAFVAIALENREFEEPDLTTLESPLQCTS